MVVAARASTWSETPPFQHPPAEWKGRHQTAERLVHALEHGNIVIYYDKPGDAVRQSLDSWTDLCGGQWSGIVVTYRGRGPEKPVR